MRVQCAQGGSQWQMQRVDDARLGVAHPRYGVDGAHAGGEKALIAGVLALAEADFELGIEAGLTVDDDAPGAVDGTGAALRPLLDIRLSEIIDFLVEVGERLHLERNPYLQECLEYIAATNPLPRRVVENLYREAPLYLSRQLLESMVESNFANREALDGWIERVDPHGSKLAIRAFPPRIVHMLAGNAPAGCVASIAQGAIVKAVNLFKMPSSDPFTTVAVLHRGRDRSLASGRPFDDCRLLAGR